MTRPGPAPAKGAPAPPAATRLQLFAHRHPLPRRVRPFPDETAESYLDRLASANFLDAGDLRAYLAGDKRGRNAVVDTAALAALAGFPEEALRCAMPEFSSPAQLAGSPWILGRARPQAAAAGPACRRCAAARGAAYIVRWRTHENVICLRHLLWTHVRYHGLRAQLDLQGHPEIIAANRLHRRLIRRFGRPAVRAAFGEASRICGELHKEWQEAWGMRLPGLGERLGSLGHGRRVLFGDPAADAALYPHVVALTRLLASPGWTGPVLDEHPGGLITLTDLDVDEIDAEIRRRRPEGARYPNWEEVPLLREAVLLGSRPGTRRFVGEIRRTVLPNYAWLPLPYYRRCEPLAEWVRERVRDRESPYGDLRHSAVPSEVYTAAGLHGPA